MAQDVAWEEEGRWPTGFQLRVPILMEGNPMKANGVRHNSYRSALWRALIVSAAGAIAIPALATDAQATHQRTVTGNVSMRIMDWENFGPNTVCNRGFSLTPVVLTKGGRAESNSGSAKCGGEIRVEVHYTVAADPNGVVRVTAGRVDLFEEDTEDNNDLDGRRALGNAILFPGASATWNAHVQNWAEGEPDDKADVTLTLRN
ncbi:hypothetical protein ACFY94_27850 [Streptomyces griseorubiginosus]|uniref:hypothetical protein n=1 Tax=Streptomyces griseorubiginosus TaxID=67304 RepID=UPI0036E5037B